VKKPPKIPVEAAGEPNSSGCAAGTSLMHLPVHQGRAPPIQVADIECHQASPRACVWVTTRAGKAQAWCLLIHTDAALARSSIIQVARYHAWGQIVRCNCQLCFR